MEIKTNINLAAPFDDNDKALARGYFSLPSYARLVGMINFRNNKGKRAPFAGQGIWVLDNKVYRSPLNDKTKAILIAEDWLQFCQRYRAQNIVDRTMDIFHINGR